MLNALLRRLPGGVAPILLATAVAGGAGYVVTAAVPLFVEPSEYAHFSVLWSVLYLAVAVLGGVQQEVSRAARPRASAPRGARPGLVLALGGAAVALVAVLAVGFPLVRSALGDDAGPAIPAVAVAAGSYVVVAVLSGLLSGLGRWRVVAALIALDGVLRIVCVLGLLAAGAGVTALMWGVAAPFALVPLLLWPLWSRALAGRVGLDVATPALVWNAARAVAGAAAGGLLVSGYPLVLALVASGAGTERLATVNLAVNLVRAPLVVVVLALQSYLVVRFRAAGEGAGRLALRVLALVGLAGVAAAGAAGLVGPPVLRLFGPSYDVSGWFLAGLVLGSAALGALCVTGTLALARGRHGRYLAGWGLAALATVAVLVVPGDLETRVVLSLLAGPVLGAACHLLPSSRAAHPVRSVPDLPPTRETT